MDIQIDVILQPRPPYLAGHIERVKALLCHWSEEKKEQVESGKLDRLIHETFDSPQAYTCIAQDREIGIDVGMYLATVKSGHLSRVLYIDSVVVHGDYRGQGVLVHHLGPHMQSMAVSLQCSKIELSSSESHAQRAYKSIGFTEESCTFRLHL